MENYVYISWKLGRIVSCYKNSTTSSIYLYNVKIRHTLFDIHCLVAESDNDWSKAVCFGYFRRKDDRETKRSLQWLVDCTRRIRVEHFPTCLSNCQSTLVRSPGCCTSLSKITYRDIRSWRATGIAVYIIERGNQCNPQKKGNEKR